MNILATLSRWIDRLNAYAGRLANLMILLSCLVSAVNALIRYGYDWSDNWPLELQWYLFGTAVMFGAAYTFQRNEHVRVDLIYGRLSLRAQQWVDIFGILVFLLPACLLFAWLSFDSLFMPSWRILEQSTNSGGLPRYPIKFVLPLGFVLLALQGISELIKRIVALQSGHAIASAYERPLQ